MILFNVVAEKILLVYTEGYKRDYKRKNIQDITGTWYFSSIFWEDGGAFQ